MTESNYNDKIKAKVDEIDIDAKVKELAAKAEELIAALTSKAGHLATENHDKLVELLDKAGAAIDEKTEGKYHHKVEKAKASALQGLAKLQDQGPGSASASASSAASSDAADTWAAATDAPVGGDDAVAGPVPSVGSDEPKA